MPTMTARMTLVLGVLVATALGMSRNARAAELPVPTLGEALRSATATGLTIPAAWAGIWATEDSVHFCSDPMILFASSGFDTLCTGGPIEEGGGDMTLTCTGSIDDDSANVTCTGTDEVYPGCNVDYDMTIVATRNGDNFFTETTLNAAYAPPFCDSAPDACFVTETTSTRVAPEPPICSTPVESGTWGMLKARYH